MKIIAGIIGLVVMYFIAKSIGLPMFFVGFLTCWGYLARFTIADIIKEYNKLK